MFAVAHRVEATTCTIELSGYPERKGRFLSTVYLPTMIQYVDARIRRRGQDQTRSLKPAQTIIALDSRRAPMKNSNSTGLRMLKRAFG